jgi:DNA-binding CsgD family transcriptional regulator
MKADMKPEIFREANKIWNRLTEYGKGNGENIPITIHKKLLDIFHVGEYYYFILNVQRSAFEMISEEVETVLGYSRAEANIGFLLGQIHPDDQPFFLDFENTVADFFLSLSPEQILNYKVSYDYRMRRKDGNYIRILHQVVTIQTDENRRVVKTFGIHTNITHLKSVGIPLLSFIGLNGEPSYMDVKVKQVYTASGISLSRRERQILSLLIQGKKSGEISTELFISKYTVDTHRRNLLQKTNSNNTASLISMAAQKGWL